MEGKVAEWPPVMSPKTLSGLLDGIAVSTLSEWRKPGVNKGPEFFRIGGLVRYRAEAVIEWLDGLSANY